MRLMPKKNIYICLRKFSAFKNLLFFYFIRINTSLLEETKRKSNWVDHSYYVLDVVIQKKPSMRFKKPHSCVPIDDAKPNHIESYP